MNQDHAAQRPSKFPLRYLLQGRVLASPAIAFVILVCITLICLQVWLTVRARAVQLEVSKTAIANVAEAVAQHASDTIQLADTILANTVERIQVEGQDDAKLGLLHDFLVRRVAELPQLHSVSMFGPDGRRLVSSLPAAPPNLNNKDREYFSYHIDHDGLGVHLGSPVRSRTTGNWVIPVSRRISRPDGSFGGVAVVTLRIEYFNSYFGRFNIGQRGAIFLALDSGIMLVRRPYAEASIGRDISNFPLFKEYLPQSSTATVVFRSSQDGVERINSYRRLKQYPLVVSAALAKDEALATWRADAIVQCGTAVVVVMALGGLGIHLLNQMRLKLQAEAASLAKGQFLSNMSHEIRTPLNCVIGMAHLAIKSDLTPRQRDYVEKILAAGGHVLGIIDNILDIAKIEAGKLELEHVDFSLNQVTATLKAIMGPKAAARGLELAFDIDPDLPPMLRGDPLRLGQMLVNYTDNAIKFSEKGPVSIHVRKVAGDTSTCMLRFEVSDHGIGLSHAQMGNLFRSFEQADVSTTKKYGGTGLGLAISKQLAELMNGAVGVESQLGAGSTFWFTVQLGIASPSAALPEEAGKEASAAPASALECRDMERLKAARILLVEDNEFNQEIAQEMLEQEGCAVCIAHNGAEALKVMGQCSFDCVLMDLQMPVMDGIEATRRIRATPQIAATPILAMTATATMEARQRCIDAGMNDFISKPIRPMEMYRTIAHWLPAVPSPAPGPIAAEVVASAPVAVDFSVLASIVGDDPAKLAKFAHKFLLSAQQGIGEMELAQSREDIQGIRDVAHRIKSSARAVGAVAMADLCQTMEQMANVEARPTQVLLSAMVAQLRGLLDQVAKQIQHEYSH